MVSDCTLKRLGDLPFDFPYGTCGTFMIGSLPTIPLCFDDYEQRKCRSLTRRNDGALSDINDFVFDTEFQMDQIIIPDSTNDHYGAIIANYQGFPLILGGTRNNKLEMLNTMENPLRWIEYEGTDYPYSNRYVIFSQSEMIKIYFSIYDYAVTSTSTNVIYFGGNLGDQEGGKTDRVVEFRSLEWILLGYLASPRDGHRSIEMDNKIYLIGGHGTT